MDIKTTTAFLIDGKLFLSLQEAKEYQFETDIQKIVKRGSWPSQRGCHTFVIDNREALYKALKNYYENNG